LRHFGACVALALLLAAALVPTFTLLACCQVGQCVMPASGEEARTYTMWSYEHDRCVAALCALKANEATLVVGLTNISGSWSLFVLDGRNGSLLARTREFAGAAYEILALGAYVVVAANSTLMVFNTSLSVSWERQWPGSEIKGLGALSASDVLFLKDLTLYCLSLEEMKLKWYYDFGEARELSACPMFKRGALIIRCENGTWYACLVDLRGRRGLDRELEWLSWARRVAVRAYNSTYFLLTAENGTYRSLCLVSLTDMAPRWSARLSTGPFSGPFLAPDLDGDGAPELLLWSSGRLCLLSGSEGRDLLSVDYEAPVASVAWLGGPYLALRDAGGTVRLLAIKVGAEGISWFWSLSGATCMCSIGDLDGDGYSDLLVARGASVECLWGSYDDEAPILVSLWPADKVTTSIPEVIFMAKAYDSQSGIKAVIFVVDGVAFQGSLDPSRGCYVVKVKLGEGRHTWYVETEDRVGYIARSGERTLMVNTSFFGGPGWLDDMLFFAPWAIALVAIGVFFSREKHRRRAVSQPLPSRNNIRPWPSGACPSASPLCSRAASWYLGPA